MKVPCSGLAIVLMSMTLPIGAAADPTISITYCSYLGGSATDYGVNLELDRHAHRYVVTGATHSVDHPTTFGAYDTSHNSLPYSQDVFITAFDTGDHTLVYSTYFGGDGGDQPNDLTLDDDGNVYVGGWSDSIDLPTTPGAYDMENEGWFTDGFVVSLTPSLDTLRWCTYIGGGDYEEVTALFHDPAGYLYVGGYTTPYPGYPHYGGIPFDFTLLPDAAGFVAKFRTVDGSLVWIGGVASGYVSSFDLSHAGGLLVAGSGREAPVSAGAYDTTPNGESDLFVMSLDKDDGSFDWGTYIGGSWIDTRIGIQTSSSGDIHFAACTDSDDFPLSATGWGSVLTGEGDVVVGALSEDGANLLWARNLGGSAFDGSAVSHSRPRLREDDEGNLIVATSTMSEDIATTPASLYPEYLGVQDVLLASLSTTGETCRWISYLGGSYMDRASGIELVPSGLILLGSTGLGAVNPALPVSGDAFDQTLGGHIDAFVMELEDPTIVGLVVEDVSLVQDGEEIVLSWRTDVTRDPNALRVDVRAGDRTYGLPVTSRDGLRFRCIDDSVCADGAPERSYRVNHLAEDGLELVLLDRSFKPDCPDSGRWDLAVSYADNDEILFALRLGAPASVRLRVYDVKGRQVAVLPGETLSVGEHVLRWDGAGTRGRSLPSGRYLASCILADRELTASFTILK